MHGHYASLRVKKMSKSMWPSLGLVRPQSRPLRLHLILRAVSTDHCLLCVFAGIIGLCTAHALLQNTDLSVALIERNQQVPGASLNNGAATGAGKLLQVSHLPYSALESVYSQDGSIFKALDCY